MQLIEQNTSNPEGLVALDEILLRKAEAGEIGESLRLWQARNYFVVVGRAVKIGKDCFLDKCRKANLKIIERISGGHAVLQGPGCLNYSLVLSYERDKEYKTDIRYSYEKILGSLANAFNKKGFPVQFLPASDLALSERKFSGNAQARKRRYFLHHGTILFDFDIDRISYFLRHPSTEPAYRKGRVHKDFLTNIPISVGGLEGIIKTVFLK